MSSNHIEFHKFMIVSVKYSIHECYYIIKLIYKFYKNSVIPSERWQTVLVEQSLAPTSANR